jgi:hypothetical protein
VDGGVLSSLSPIVHNHLLTDVKVKLFFDKSVCLFAKWPFAPYVKSP